MLKSMKYVLPKVSRWLGRSVGGLAGGWAAGKICLGGWWGHWLGIVVVQHQCNLGLTFELAVTLTYKVMSGLYLTNCKV